MPCAHDRKQWMRIIIILYILRLRFSQQMCAFILFVLFLFFCKAGKKCQNSIFWGEKNSSGCVFVYSRTIIMHSFPILLFCYDKNINNPVCHLMCLGDDLHNRNDILKKEYKCIILVKEGIWSRKENSNQITCYWISINSYDYMQKYFCAMIVTAASVSRWTR